MREHHLQHKRRKRFVATTASHHDRPIFPKPICDRMFDGPKQVWVADITYIGIAVGFVYMAAVPDARPRRVVGYAVSHRRPMSTAARSPITASSARWAGVATHTSSAKAESFMNTLKVEAEESPPTIVAHDAHVYASQFGRVAVASLEPNAGATKTPSPSLNGLKRAR